MVIANSIKKVNFKIILGKDARNYGKDLITQDELRINCKERQKELDAFLKNHFDLISNELKYINQRIDEILILIASKKEEW
jgi:hypothetical protein